jgi:hypothetical protein
MTGGYTRPNAVSTSRTGPPQVFCNVLGNPTAARWPGRFRMPTIAWSAPPGVPIKLGGDVVNLATSSRRALRFVGITGLLSGAMVLPATAAQATPSGCSDRVRPAQLLRVLQPRKRRVPGSGPLLPVRQRQLSGRVRSLAAHWRRPFDGVVSRKRGPCVRQLAVPLIVGRATGHGLRGSKPPRPHAVTRTVRR